MSLVPAFGIGVGNAWIFTTIYTVVLSLFMLLSKKTSIKTSISATQEEKSKIALRFYEVSFYIAVVYSVFLPLQIGTLWFVAGLIIFILGLSLCFTAWVYFAVTPLDEPVITGIYRYSRHPIYLGLFFIFTGIGIASASWLFLFITVIRTISSFFMVTPEERYCLEKYSNAYQEYINRTPRWIGLPKSG